MQTLGPVNNPFTLLALFASLCYLFAFAKVWGQKRDTRIHKAFLIFTFNYFCITILEYLSRQNYSFSLVTLFSHIAAFLFLPSGFLILNLVYSLMNKKIDNLYKFALLITVLGLPVIFIPDSIRIDFNDSRGYYLSTPSILLAITFLISSIIPGFLAVYAGIIQYTTTSNLKEKKILKLFLIGLCISIFFGITMLVILPFFFPQKLPLFYEFSALTTLFLLFYIYKAVHEYYLRKINYTELELVSKSLFSNLEEAVIILGKLGEVVESNHNAKKLLGKINTVEDLSSKVENYNYKSTYLNYKTSIKRGSEDSFIILNQTDVERDGNFLGKLLIIKDVSKEEKLRVDQENLEKQLQRSEKMQAIGQLAGGVAHDFNNQLAAIMGCADLINEEVEDNEYLHELSSNILESAQKAGSLTQQLLAFAQKGKYLSCPVNIHFLISEIASFLSRSIDKKIEIIKTFNAADFTVTGDPSQLNNAFLNLSLNARDAMKDGGVLTFSTENCHLNQYDVLKLNREIKEGNYIKIEIMDTGCGIPEEIHNKIFDPFFTTKQLGSGTGMGLAAVYGIIRNHQGHIVVNSRINEGTTFSIYLPLSEKLEEKMRETVKPKQDNVENLGNVLIIDDEKIINLTTSITLEKLGYKPVAFDDSQEALEHYKNNFNEYDIIILDLIMPRIDGYELFKLFMEINPNSNILIASGYSLDSKTQKLLDQGARGFIQKPFRKIELERKINEILKGKKAK